MTALGERWTWRLRHGRSCAIPLATSFLLRQSLEPDEPSVCEKRPGGSRKVCTGPCLAGQGGRHGGAVLTPRAKADACAPLSCLSVSSPSARRSMKRVLDVDTLLTCLNLRSLAYRARYKDQPLWRKRRRESEPQLIIVGGQPAISDINSAVAARCDGPIAFW